MMNKELAMFDEVACEEFYNEDMDRWMDELEIDYVNGELQVIADEQAEARVEVEAEALYFGA